MLTFSDHVSKISKQASEQFDVLKIQGNYLTKLEKKKKKKKKKIAILTTSFCLILIISSSEPRLMGELLEYQGPRCLSCVCLSTFSNHFFSEIT